MAYLQITLSVADADRAAAAAVYQQYTKPFLDTVAGARSKELRAGRATREQRDPRRPQPSVVVPPPGPPAGISPSPGGVPPSPPGAPAPPPMPEPACWVTLPA